MTIINQINNIMKNQKVTVEVPAGYRAEWVNGVLTLVGNLTDKVSRVLDKSLPITERVKTFEDAEVITGMTLPAPALEYLPKDVIAYMKLRIIAAALNGQSEGTLDEFPKFEKSEYRWYPWFLLYTQKEIDEMSEEQKSRVVLRSYSSAVAYGGVACACAYFDSSYAYTSYGSRLAFKTKELAKYAGEQFIEIWADLVFKPREDCEDCCSQPCCESDAK